MFLAKGLAVALAAMAIATSAAADTKTLARIGSWEAFGGTTTNGNGVCGVSAEAGKRYFGVKLFAGGKTFTIQLGTSEWQVTKGEKIAVNMRLDANPVWRATGTAFIFEDGDGGLQYDINQSELDNFVREFRNSSRLSLQFDGRFPEWIMGLEGTMAVYGAFQNCTRTLK